MAKLSQESLAVRLISCVVSPVTMERFRRTMSQEIGEKKRNQAKDSGAASEVEGKPREYGSQMKKAFYWRKEWCHMLAERPNKIMGQWL